MGAWSTTIMGNDNALDIECNIYDRCGVEMYPGDSSVKSTLPIDELQGIQEQFLIDYVNEEEGAIVLAVVMMEVGAKISPEVKEVAIKNAEADEWAQNDSSREKHINDFIKTLKEYDNQTPRQVKGEGLFQKIAEKIAEGGKGLVNL